jgi:hypothetical protein
MENGEPKSRWTAVETAPYYKELSNITEITLIQFNFILYN